MTRKRNERELEKKRDGEMRERREDKRCRGEMKEREERKGEVRSRK